MNAADEAAKNRAVKASKKPPLYASALGPKSRKAIVARGKAGKQPAPDAVPDGEGADDAAKPKSAPIAKGHNK